MPGAVRGWFVRVLLVTVLLQTAVYAIRPMVSYRALSIGADNFDLGLIAAAFASLSLVVAVPIGRWVDRWGEPRFIVVGSAVIAAVSFWLLMIDSVVALALSQAGLGFGHIMSVVGTQTLIANSGDPARRDGRFGIFTVVVSTGQLAGPALAGLLAGSGTGAPGSGAPDTGSFSTAPVFWSAALVTALASLVALTLVIRGPDLARTPGGPVGEAPSDDSSETGRSRKGSAGQAPRQSYWHALGRVLRIPSMPHAMIASLTVLTTIDLLAVYLPAYGEANGLSVQTVGLLLGVRAAASMASRILMLPLIRLLGRRRLLVASILAPAAALALFPFTESSFLLYVAMAVAGFGLGLGQPITLAWVADRAPADIRGTALGVRLSGNRLGQTVLPAVVGAVAGASGLAAVFLSLAALLALSGAAVYTASFGHGEQAEP